MNIVITGASGFIGAQLLQAARAADGAGTVTAFSSRPAAGSSIVYDATAPGFGLDTKALALIEAADVLIHAGAFTPKNAAEANALEGNNGNIALTAKLLALPFGNLKKILFLSTLDVYAVAERISETTPAQPASLYGLSKLYCESMVSLYAAQRRIDGQILRIGHVYGPGEEKYAKFLPRAIQNIVAGNDVELWGDGSELRSFIYIDDVVRAILAALALEGNPGIINIVGGQPISIRQLLDKLIAISDRPVRITQREFNGPKRDFVFDTAKLKQYLLPEESDFTAGLLAELRHIEAIR
jgi:UDP-glucose 4-epimerase